MPIYSPTRRQCKNRFTTTNPRHRICSDTCRRGIARARTREWRKRHDPAEPSHPCRDCTKPTWGVRCPDCWAQRKANKARCIYCGGVATGTRCRDCHTESVRIYGNDHHKGRRSTREKIVGLTKTRQRALLHKWQRQGRTCTFCESPCASTDHVIPLARGGTNYEGNLTPACIPCNSSRGARTITEWRLGRKHFKASTAWVLREPRIKKPLKKALIYQRTCTECSTEFQTTRPNQVRCSVSCRASHQRATSRAYARDRYRTQVGIPTNTPLYALRNSKPTVRSAA